MQCLQINFEPETGTVTPMADALPETWEAVCERYDNDVHRIMDYTDKEGYSAIYTCYDEDNQPAHYLVEEGEALNKLRHKTFLEKLGRP